MKMKICYDQGCNGIGVVIATKWRYYLFYLQQYISALGTVLRKLFTIAFSSNSSLDFLEICKSVIKIFWDKDFVVRNTIKNGQSWCSAVICRKRSACDMQFHLIVLSIFLKPFVRDQGDSSSRLLERRFWLVCIEALLLAVFWTFWSTLIFPKLCLWWRSLCSNLGGNDPEKLYRATLSIGIKMISACFQLYFRN